MPVGEHIDTTSYAGTHNDKEKVAAWSEWGSRRFSHMRVLYDAGLLGPENREWRNIAEHSVVVNATAMYIAQKIAESTADIDIALVDDGSILHDATKRLERESDVSYATEHGSSIKRDFLHHHGYADNVIGATEYTGRVPEIFIENDDEQTEMIAKHPIEELIVAYADARVRNTAIVSLEDARDLNKKKVPKDEGVYDKWYTFYKRVEERLISEMHSEATTPESISNASVMAMVKLSKTS